MNIKTKLSLYILTALIFSLGFVDHVHAAWYDASWTYRKKVTVTGQSGAGTNYQVKLLVGQSSGSTGANFHLENHVKSDFGDLRFTDSGGSTLLPYWIESTSGTTPNQTATVWVKVAADLGANQDIYVYYGNSGATSAASGTNTFLFFDDFSGDLSKWTIDPENTDTVSISSGAMRQNPDSSQSKNAYSDNRVRTASFQMTDGALAYKVYEAGASNRKIHQFGWRVDGLSFGSGYAWRMQNSAADGGFFYFAGNAWTQTGPTYGAISSDTWYNVEMKVAGTAAQAFVNGVSAGTLYNSTTAGPGYLASHLHGVSLGAGDYVLIDDVRVRKYIATEPAYSSVLGEESGTPRNVFYSVGQSTSNLGVGSSISISSGAATFSVAQTKNIGVGDRVTYNAANITSVADAGSGNVTISTSGSNFQNGDYVTISGTTDYNGSYVISNAAASSFGNNWQSFGTSGSGNGQFSSPSAAIVDAANNKIYVADYFNARIIRMDSGTGGTTFGANWQTYTNANIGGFALDVANNKLYAMDTGNRKVLRMDSGAGGTTFGANVQSFGAFGTGVGQFRDPYGIAFDATNNKLYIADTTNNRIVWMDSGTGGTTLGANWQTFGTNGTGDGQFVGPHGVALDLPNNKLYIADYNNNRIVRMDSGTGGTTLGASWQAFGTIGTGDGQFNHPWEVRLEASINKLYVTDMMNNRIIRMDSGAGGTTLGANWQTFGTNGTGNQQFSYSAGLDVDTVHNKVFATDYSNGRAINIDSGSGNAISFNITHSFTSSQTGTAANIAYISAKTNVDMMHWNLITPNGGTPRDVTNLTLSEIKHEYTTLNGAISGASDSNHLGVGTTAANSNLTSLNVVLNIPCYMDSGTADTTAVSVSGYTTGASNYIKIYTPSNTSTESNIIQRHNGKAGTTNYRIQISNGQGINVSNNVNYTVIDGIEFIGGGDIYDHSGVKWDLASDITIKNCIAHNFRTGYGPYRTSGSNKLYNNISYDNRAGFYVYSEGGSSAYYLYNNTAYNNQYGFDGRWTDATFKNNLASNSSVADFYKEDATGTFTMTNNASSDGTADDWGGSGNKVNQTFKFQNAANKDFHLGFLDTSALNAGTDLSADANLAFNTDIDGQARNTLGAWDIGADEATTPIYRSVGVGATSPITTGTNNGLVITGSTANFQAPLPDNVGVGDALQYDSNQDGTVDALAFIYYRIDSTHYIVKQKDGTAPTAVSASKPDVSWGIYRAYTSLFDVMSNGTGGTENSGIAASLKNFDNWSAGKDIVTPNEQWNIACYGNASGTGDSLTSTIYDGSNWKTGPLNYVKMYSPYLASEVGISQRHQGKFDSTKYYLNNISSLQYNTFYVAGGGLNYVRFDGLQYVKNGSATGASGLITSAGLKYGQAYISNNIVVSQTGTRFDSGITIQGAITAYVYNNIVYKVAGTGIMLSDAAGKVYAYNNTIYDTSTYWGIANYLAGGYLLAKNNIVQAANDLDYSGTFASGSDYNISSDASKPGGANDKTSKTVNFVSTTSGSEDFHLTATNVDAKDTGADLSTDIYLPITTDIDGQPRMSGTAFDIGADERLNNVYYSVGQNTADLKNGSPTLTVDANSNADLAVAQTGNMGVGDYIEYGTAPYQRAYIAGKNGDGQHWKVVTALGDPIGVGTTMPINAIKHTFSTLAGAIASASGASYVGNSGNLLTSGVILNIPCYYDTGSDTTRVTISSYTTGANNYIKIYTPYNTSTEANNSQRASGKWDGTKYNLVTTAAADYQDALRTTVNYTKIDGLQIKNNAAGFATFNIATNGLTAGANKVEISNNILTSDLSGNVSAHGISSYDANSIVYVSNNILYDIQGRGIDAGGTSYYISNNTFYNTNQGINSTGGAFIKNNASFNSRSGSDYVNGFKVGSINNASSDSTANQYNLTNGLVNKVAANEFVDVANRDFHLLPTSSLKDVGVDLSSDLNLPITTDIDGHTRNANVVTGAYDIGADEATTKIYRSIAPGATGNIGTTTQGGTFSVSGNVGTFTTAPGTHVGVGDVIQYDSDNNGSIDAIAFISGRTSATQYTLQNTIGGAPTATSAPDADWSLFRAYTALNSAAGSSGSGLGGTENTGINATYRNFDTWSKGKNIQAANEQWNIAAYANGTTPDTVTLTVSLSASSWITGPANYLKIYTPVTAAEVGVSQRHQGKWDDSKYKIESTAMYGLESYVNYMQIDGLQVRETYSHDSGATDRAIILRPTGKTVMLVTNNIVVGVITDNGGSARGIDLIGGTTGIIANNIVYGFSVGANGAGISVSAASSTTGYVYNNTVYGCNMGILRNVSALVAKNNISYNNTTDYSGGMSAGSVNNISKDGNSPNAGATDCGGHSCRTQTVSFVDAANGDFHLAGTDTAARNVGADLSADANLAFNADIDGHTRGNQGGWDIGADEGAVAIYYSVGQSTAADLKSGTPKISLSGYAATFDAAQTGNIGVGDLVTYSGGSCFISGKTSTTVWNCQNATGGTAPQVSSVSVTSIKRAFDSLEHAVDAGTATGSHDASHMNTTDLATNNYQLNIPCYYDTGADTTGANVQNWTTIVPNYIKIYTPNNTLTEVNNSQRHNGKWANNIFTVVANNASPDLTVFVSNVKILGLQLDKAASSVSSGIASGSSAGQLEISNNIIRNVGSGIYLQAVVGNYKVIDNIIYSTSTQGIYIGNASSSFVYNNTLVNNPTGFTKGCVSNANNYIINNLFSGNTNDYSNSACGGDPNFTYNATNNASGGGASIPAGTGNKYSQSFASTFADATNNDYHLNSVDTVAKNAGTNLSADANYAFSTDIDGSTRNLDGRGWDIGADEAATQVFYSVGQNTANLMSSTAPTTLDIASGAGTFSVAQTGNIGVGDRVTYNTDKIAYITAKTNSDGAHWSLSTATGALPADVSGATVNSITHSFTTLNGAIAGASGASMMNTTDLPTSNLQLNVPCYMDSGTADTTAVTISGYTTAATNYIRIYTPNNTNSEANFSQRHQGKWDDGKYNVSVAAGAGIEVQVKNAYIDGLQIKMTRNNQYGWGIRGLAGSYGQLNVTNNIVQGVLSGSASSVIGIYASGINSNSYVANNVVYGFANGNINSNYGILAASYNQNAYLYNNTVYNSYNAFGRSDGTTLAKNNIAQKTTVGYSGTFSASSANNVSDHADAPGSNAKNNAIVNFVDAPHGDFHLAQNDTAARNAGADLSADTNLAVTTDIDGHPRSSVSNPSGGSVSPDIGADEGATYVYYSVGQNTSDHKTGSPTITLSGYNASLSVAQTAPNMGVGDLITYTGGSCFISGKTDTQHWSCQNATGGTAPQVSGVSVTSIAHAIAGLNNATYAWGNVAATNSSHLNTKDLYAGNYVLNIPCYYDTGADSTANVLGWTTSANNYIKVYTPTNTDTEVNQGQRHSGIWNENKFNISVGSNTYGIILGDLYIWLDGLQVTSANYSPVYSRQTTYYPGQKGEVKISNSIFKGDGVSTSYGLNTFAPAMTYKIWNNLFYNVAASASDAAIGVSGSSYIYNNTIASTISGFGVRNISASISSVYKNNIISSTGQSTSGLIDSSSTNNVVSRQASDGANGTSADSGTTNSSGVATNQIIQTGKHFTRDVKVGMIVKNTTNNSYSYVKSVDSDTQLTLNDAISGTSKAYTIYTNRYGTVSFANAANNDFHLAGSDAVAKVNAADLSNDLNLPFSSDVDGQLRPANKWDIGADQYIAEQVGGPDNGQNDSSANPVVWYKFNEGIGSTAYNSGSGGATFNGTLQPGSTTVTQMWSKNGKYDSALSLGGDTVNNYVSTSSDPLAGKSAVSVSAWIKNTSQFFSKGIAGAWKDDTDMSALLFTDSMGKLYWRIKANSTATASTTTVVEDGNWHHVVGTYDGNAMKIYVDGHSEGTPANTTGTIASSTYAFEIGRYGHNSNTSFLGLLDDVKVFDYALSADQVKREYDGGSVMQFGSSGAVSGSGAPTNSASGDYCVPGDTTSCAAPVGEWKMDEGTGTSTRDTSGNGNDGTLAGATWTQGKIGRALSFDGSSYVTTPLSHTINSGDFTAGAWVKTTASGIHVFFGTTLVGGNNMWLGTFSDDQVAISINGSTLEGGSILDGKWHYIVGLRKSGNAYLYVDGMQKGTPTSMSGAVTTNTYAIGAAGGGGAPWSGSIDQVRFYSYARTPAQIAWEYNKGKPMAWWKMDDNVPGNGQTIHDNAPAYNVEQTANNGTTNWGGNGSGMDCTVAGKYSKACSFDGTDDYISIGGSSPGGAQTVSVWANLSDIVSDRAVFGQATAANTFSLFVKSSDGNIYCQLGNTSIAVNTNTQWPVGQWANLVMVRDASKNAWVYLNGRPISQTASPHTGNANPDTFWIGRDSYSTRYWKGQIDDVKIFNYALTSDQVKMLYNDSSAVNFGN